MTIFEMLAVAQQLQTVLVLENPELVMKVDSDYLKDSGRYLTIMAGLWDGNKFCRYKNDHLMQNMSTDDVLQTIRKFREVVESWGAK
jgi:hypothetical protein